MSAHEANNPYDVLRLAPGSAPTVNLDGAAEPQLEIGWGDFHQGVASNFAELFRRPRVPKDFLVNSFFRFCWIDNPLPRRAMLAAALWHIAFVVMPFPQIAAPKRNPAFDNAQITWSGPVEDFPLIEAPAARPAAAVPVRQPESEAADAFHPRQRIFTDPVHPNHPRQTLIQPRAPLDPPKILPNLPNMVELAKAAQPERPRLEVNQQFLKQLHPLEKRMATDPHARAPELQLNDTHSADLALAMNNAGPERPKLQINAGVAPRAAEHKQDGGPAPDVASEMSSPNGSGQALIALSATPGPPAPVAPPPGNLAARVALSPDGKKPGAAPDPGPGAAAGTSSVGVSISGGSPKSGNTISGPGAAKLSMPSARPNGSRADAERAEAPPVTSEPPNFAVLPPDAKPEAIFALRRVYSLNVNMPNLNSATGSWILNFTEMRTTPGAPPGGGKEIAAPSPLRKVDPKYPPTAVAEHIEGEVILYAVIRRDGSVDSIQLVRGIDDQLDANAMHALAQWKFRPAERDGQPLDLEAIVHIPFRAPER